ncbi:SMI1/KNR4 family protein [Streptomyces atratus]|uniref:SMI1/KNR4 family protein n=1 Tax=Streptomyces atratus TaxID=1893 RepID=UPI0021A7CF9D|nr:SMI1/KNR4 family protein [Streptomyces atratus]MCT2544049.1 SMI1/KNR4 family protein [Streptomyces atratus]
MAGDVVWTDEQRGKVYSTRARVNPDHLTEGLGRGPCWLAAVPPFDAAGCFAEARDKSRHAMDQGWEYAVHEVEEGARHAAPSMAALGLRAAALYRSDERPDVLDLDVEVAMVELQLQATWDAVPFWLAAEGVAWTLRAMLRLHELAHNRHEVHCDPGLEWSGTWLIETTAHASFQVAECESSWQLLRGVLAVADEADHHAARAVAAAAFDVAPVPVKAALSFVFPDEREWADRAAEDCLAQGCGGDKVVRMLVTTAGVDRGERLVERQPGCLDEATLLTLLAREGAGAAPVLDSAMRHARGNNERLVSAHHLAMIRTRDAAERLAAWRGNRRLAPLIEDYFRQAPHLEPSPSGASEPRIPAEDATAAALTGLFEEYRTWYREHWVPKLLGDTGRVEEELDAEAWLDEEGWLDPTGDLSPVGEDDIAALEARFGPLPADYRAFLHVIGTGTLLQPMQAMPGAALEPTTRNFIHPADIPGAHTVYTRWLHDGWHEENAGVVDMTRMMPVMGHDGYANFVLLSLQHEGDDRVHVWYHDEEPERMDGGVPFVEFLRRMIDSARREEPFPGGM